MRIESANWNPGGSTPRISDPLSHHFSYQLFLEVRTSAKFCHCCLRVLKSGIKQKNQQKAVQSVRVKQDCIKIMRAHGIEPMTFTCSFSKDTLEGKSLMPSFEHGHQIFTQDELKNAHKLLARMKNELPQTPHTLVTDHPENFDRDHK